MNPAPQLPDGSGVVSQCRSPSLSLIQPQRPSSKEQLRYPDSEEKKTKANKPYSVLEDVKQKMLQPVKPARTQRRTMHKEIIKRKRNFRNGKAFILKCLLSVLEFSMCVCLHI